MALERELAEVSRLQSEMPKSIIQYHVIAYDDSGYGDNQSREFEHERDAVEYARSRERRFQPAIVMKHTFVKPIQIKPIQVFPPWQQGLME